MSLNIEFRLELGALTDKRENMSRLSARIEYGNICIKEINEFTLYDWVPAVPGYNYVELNSKYTVP